MLHYITYIFVIATRLRIKCITFKLILSLDGVSIEKKYT